MSNFFTWGTLGTYAGAVAATSLFTQFLKETALFKPLPTRIFSYIIAALILVGVTIASGAASLGGIGLALINAVVVSLAANGAFDGYTDASALPEE